MSHSYSGGTRITLFRGGYTLIDRDSYLARVSARWRPVQIPPAASLSTPLHDCARAGRGLSVAGTAWRWGSSPATRTAVTTARARPPRSRRASFCGRRQAGPTEQNAVLGVQRHTSTRARWIFGRTRALQPGSDQARRKPVACVRGNHPLQRARSAFRTCAVGCEWHCIGAYVGPASASGLAKAAPLPSGPG